MLRGLRFLNDFMTSLSVAVCQKAADHADCFDRGKLKGNQGVDKSCSDRTPGKKDRPQSKNSVNPSRVGTDLLVNSVQTNLHEY